MKVDVKLFAGLRCGNPALSCHGASECTVEAPEGITVRELVEKLGLNPPTLLCLVNERQERGEYRLRDNDRVAFFPPLSGG